MSDRRVLRTRSLFPSVSHPGFGRLRNRKDCSHVRGQCFAKSNGVRRESAALVPLNCNSFTNRLASMCYAYDSQFVSVSSLKGWNESHTLPNLRQSKQNVGRSTLEQNIGLYVCEAAGCV